MKVLTHEQSSSVQRTYRYLRVGIAATVAVIFVAVAVTSIIIGHPLRSVSAYYYTSAQGPFVGALIAASLGIIAISGRGAERALFDGAGLIAPLIALIPTRIDNSTIPGYAPCPPGTECVPEQFHAGIGVGLVTYAVIGLAGWVMALLLTRSTPRTTGVVVSLVTAPVILITAPLLFFVWKDGLLFGGHLVAAGAFFLLIAAVAVTDDFQSDVEKSPTRRVKRTYRIIGVIMGLNVVLTILLIVVGAEGPALPVGLIGELLALALFFVFWILQSFRVWDEDELLDGTAKIRSAARPKQKEAKV
jgi:hypothetical protein